MDGRLEYKKYGELIRQQMPCIIFYEDVLYNSNTDVVEIMENMRKIYPFIPCYRVNWLERGAQHIYIDIKSPYDVLCFKANLQIFKVSAFSQDEIHNLFQIVYNDCITHFSGPYRNKLSNNNLTKFFKQNLPYKLSSPSLI